MMGKYYARGTCALDIVAFDIGDQSLENRLEYGGPVASASRFVISSATSGERAEFRVATTRTIQTVHACIKTRVCGGG